MPERRVPSVEGVLTAAEVRRTAESIAATQQGDGALPWPDGHVEAWDHVESAMALRVAGLDAEADLAWSWLAGAQRADGTWPMATVAGAVTDAGADTNQTAYVAMGLWHTWLVTGTRRAVDPWWPTVRAALDAVLDLQAPTGELWWARGAGGGVDRIALLAASASSERSLRCGVALAELVGDPQPEWELAAARLGHAVAAHEERFADRSRFSMDWYYPVLAGAVRGTAGRDRLRARWADFVVPALGVRCVADRPWVTGAETCELVLALDALGEGRAARALYAAVQHLRHDDGSYWTGWVWPDAAHFPAERSSWTAAAVVLAAAALDRDCAAGGLFRGQLGGPVLERCGAGCAARALPT
ncbi:MAG: prenyltransferase [Actinomycetota bacterium]|nr:prenyltransferase [Actinomycetota bacterium]